MQEREERGRGEGERREETKRDQRMHVSVWSLNLFAFLPNTGRPHFSRRYLLLFECLIIKYKTEFSRGL